MYTIWNSRVREFGLWSTTFEGYLKIKKITQTTQDGKKIHSEPTGKHLARYHSIDDNELRMLLLIKIVFKFVPKICPYIVLFKLL